MSPAGNWKPNFSSVDSDRAREREALQELVEMGFIFVPAGSSIEKYFIEREEILRLTISRTEGSMTRIEEARK